MNCFGFVLCASCSWLTSSDSGSAGEGGGAEGPSSAARSCRQKRLLKISIHRSPIISKLTAGSDTALILIQWFILVHAQSSSAASGERKHLQETCNIKLSIEYI